MTTSNTIQRDAMKNIAIDDLLEMGIDQINDVLERVIWPTGQYQFLVTAADVIQATETAGAYINIKHELVAISELDKEDEADSAPEAGNVLEIRYYPGYGIENFKTTYGDLIETLEGTPTVREMIEAIVGTSWEGLVEHRQRKDKETGETRHSNQINAHYNNLTE